MFIENDPFREILDDPNVPFERRSDLLLKLDYLNTKFGVYSNFLENFENNFSDLIGSKRKISVLEVGSGLAGLSRELQKKKKNSNIEVELNLFDSQSDILKFSQDVLKKNGISSEIILASEKQLEVFNDNEFDFVISLHVIHHIRPISNAVEAINQMLRVAKKGVQLNDFHRKPGSVALFKLWNQFFGISKDLSEDGVKSMQRAYDPMELSTMIQNKSYYNKLPGQFKTSIVNPYWEFVAKKSI